MNNNSQHSHEESLIVQREAGILTLTLNRQESSNSLTQELVDQLISAVTDCGSIHMCVIRSNGKNFCSGFDLSGLRNLSDADLLLRFVRLETLLQKLYHAPFPVAVLVHGHAVGAGADLAATGTFRIAAPGATFRMPGWRFGVALGTRRLTALIGSQAARDLLIDTKVLDTDSALKSGLITDIADQDSWSALIETLAQRSATLTKSALATMLSLTVNESRAEDMAALAESASQPGLKQRIVDYGHQLKNSKK